MNEPLDIRRCKRVVKYLVKVCERPGAPFPSRLVFQLNQQGLTPQALASADGLAAMEAIALTIPNEWPPTDMSALSPAWRYIITCYRDAWATPVDRRAARKTKRRHAKAARADAM